MRDSDPASRQETVPRGCSHQERQHIASAWIDGKEGDVKGNAMRYIIGLSLLAIFVAALGALVATSAYSGDAGLGKISMIVLGGLGGIIGWIVTHYVAKPIQQIDATRREAIDVAEAYARTSTWPVRLYCRWRGYNLEHATRMMFRLGQIAGDERFSDRHRQNHLDYLYACLNAHHHLTSERVARVKQMAAAMEQSS
jgi:hypothetical protein